MIAIRSLGSAMMVMCEHTGEGRGDGVSPSGREAMFTMHHSRCSLNSCAESVKTLGIKARGGPRAARHVI